MKNRFGLSRDVPAEVRRAVRQECGFACVMCGALGQHYDHFEPEFRDAVVHNAKGIALLCGTCHQDKTSGRLSNDQIRGARERATNRWQDPPWRSHFTGSLVNLRFGSNLLIGKAVGFAFGPLEILRIDAADDPVEPWTLSGTLTHGKGHVLHFERNEVIASSGNWDVELEGRRLTFRAGTMSCFS